MKSRYYSVSIGESKANDIVKKRLIEMGFSEELEIKTYIGDEDRITYYVYNPIKYKGKEIRVLRVMSFFEYKQYLNNMFDGESYDYRIQPVIKNDRVFYDITYRTNNKIYRKVR